MNAFEITVQRKSGTEYSRTGVFLPVRSEGALRVLLYADTEAILRRLVAPSLLRQSERALEVGDIERAASSWTKPGRRIPAIPSVHSR